QTRGHKAQGFRLHYDQLAKLSRPVIVFVKPGGYAHFAVLKGVQGDRVYVADPSLGNVRMPLYRFVDMWADESGRGVIFAVERATPETVRALAESQGIPARRVGEAWRFSRPALLEWLKGEELSSIRGRQAPPASPPATVGEPRSGLTAEEIALRDQGVLLKRG